MADALNDQFRVNFYKDYIGNMAEAMKDGGKCLSSVSLEWYVLRILWSDTLVYMHLCLYLFLSPVTLVTANSQSKRVLCLVRF